MFIPGKATKPRRAALTHDVYKPPESDLQVEAPAQPAPRFYVVARSKFIILYLATLGLYEFYWFYANWRNFRDAVGAKIMPLPRAIFYIFFTHSLFSRIDATLRHQAVEYEWSPRLLATLFVIISIAGSILDRLSMREIGSPLTDIASLVILVPTMLIALQAQDAINRSQNDREGNSNRRLTISNYVWIALGTAFWMLIAIGFMDMFGLISFAS